jgi:hypothetical protein
MRTLSFAFGGASRDGSSDAGSAARSQGGGASTARSSRSGAPTIVVPAGTTDITRPAGFLLFFGTTRPSSPESRLTIRARVPAARASSPVKRPRFALAASILRSARIACARPSAAASRIRSGSAGLSLVYRATSCVSSVRFFLGTRGKDEHRRASSQATPLGGCCPKTLAIGASGLEAPGGPCVHRFHEQPSHSAHGDKRRDP